VRKFLIDDAPGKPLIRSIRENADLQAFSKFYRIRRDWAGYPLIHDRFWTYGIFSDFFTSDLSDEIKACLLSRAISLAAEEEDKSLLCALVLILEVISGFNAVTDKASIRSKLHYLHLRVQKLSLFPNMSCFWNQIVIKAFPVKEHQLYFVHDEVWRDFHSSDLPYIDDNNWGNCPGGEDAVIEKIQDISGGVFVLEYTRNAYYQGSNFWIWLYRNVSERPIWHWYIYIVLSTDGDVELFTHSMQTCVSMTPEELVVKHEYGLMG